MNTPKTQEITDRLAQIAYRFEYDSGKRPKAAYLGLNEWRELRDWVASNPLIRSSQVSGLPERAEFRGMKIFRVDADDHLGVS